MNQQHILVADDDELYLAFMEALLSDEGYRVTLVTSVDDALERLRTDRPDLLICDLWMPPAPHAALLSHVADLPELANLPIIICTAAVDEAEGISTRMQGRPTQVLLKPFDIDELIACIARAIGPK